MFNLHSAVAFQLLTLVAAAALLAWTGHAHVHAKKLVRTVAYAVGILCVLSLLCTAYYGVKYSRAGYFQSPMGMHGMMMKKGKNGGNMMEGMMDGGMMGKGGMKDGAERSEDAAPHSHDHDK